jgi:AraC-like DNA-binding protein
MKPTLYRPHGALAKFVDYFWTFEWREHDAGRTLKMFATGVSGILLQHRDGRPALGSAANGQPVSSGGCPTSFVYGKRTRPMHTFSNGPFHLTGVVFKPQGLSMLLRTDPMALNDGSAGLGNFSRDLGEQLLDARSDRERVARLSTFLRARVDDAGAEDVLVTESLQLIRTDSHSIRVPQLLKRLKVSERQLERHFIRAIGVSPHQYIRILRFRKALQFMKANQFERLSDIAYDLDFVDQSHFIKDIKAFSGYTPKRLVQTVHSGVELPCALIVAAGDDPTADEDALTASSCGRFTAGPATHEKRAKVAR